VTAASRVRLYGGRVCEDTRRSRKFLDEHGVSYEYVEVDGDPEAVARVKAWNNGNRVTPTVVVGDRVLGEPSDEELAELLGLQGD
jgi:glutaredoxin